VSSEAIAWPPTCRTSPRRPRRFFACASIGAIWTSCPPDSALAPSSTGSRRSSRRSCSRRRLPLRRQRPRPPRDGRRACSGRFPRSSGHSCSLTSVRKGTGRSCSGPVASWSSRQLPFEHPLWVLYTSGTTGLPKPIVHAQGGILLEHLKALHLHVDARAGDRLFWFTTTGWMMWNFLLGGLLTEAAVVLYDGNPAQPDLGVLWDLASTPASPAFGTSAAYFGMHEGRVRARGRARPLATAERRIDGLTSLPDGFRWVYEHVGADTWLFSTSGGTDVLHRLRRRRPDAARLRGRAPGRASAPGRVVRRSRQLARRRGRRARADGAAPLDAAVPVGGCRRLRYRESYFADYPGIWRHGDWIEITSRGTAIIYGRSDSTVNRGGIRMGTSEIYRAALALDGFVDALAVDLPARGNGWLAVPVRRPRDPGAFDDRLVARSGSASAPTAHRATCPTRSSPCPRSAHPLGQDPRGPGQAHPDGSAAGAGSEPRFARESRTRSTWFVDRARSRQSP